MWTLLHLTNKNSIMGMYALHMDEKQNAQNVNMKKKSTFRIKLDVNRHYLLILVMS